MKIKKGITREILEKESYEECEKILSVCPNTEMFTRRGVIELMQTAYLVAIGNFVKYYEH